MPVNICYFIDLIRGGYCNRCKGRCSIIKSLLERAYCLNVQNLHDGDSGIYKNAIEVGIQEKPHKEEAHKEVYMSMLSYQLRFARALYAMLLAVLLHPRLREWP